MIEKILNKKFVNLLQIVPKHDTLNSKNLHVLTRSGTGKDNNNQNHQVIRPIKNTMKYTDMQGQNDTMTKVVKLLMKET